MTIAQGFKYLNIAQTIADASITIVMRWANAKVLESGLDIKRTPTKNFYENISLLGGFVN